VRTAFLAAVLLLTAACAKKQEPPASSLLVLRFENLTGNPALDWMGRGAARQIAAEVRGATAADSYQVSVDRERAIVGGANRILHGYVSQSGGRLRLRADLEDTASRSFPQTAESSGPVSAGVAPLADAVARQLDPGASPSGAKSEAALAAYIGGLDATDGAAAAESLSRSIAADPDFGPAYLALIELSLSRKDRDAGARTLAMARARSAGFSPVDRARIEVVAAQMSGDRAALSQSLTALSRLTPSDRNLLRALADGELAAKRYPAAIDYYRKALASQPDDPALLNTLGYAQAYAGDLDGAVKTLQEYERVRPAEANPLDSLGDVHFYWGRFPEAEKFYRQAFQKDATFLNAASLVKAAKARLMTGDVSGAEGVFAEYEAARRAANDPTIGFARARWDYLRGKRSEAVRELDAFLATTKIGDVAALADCTLTVWLLQSGDPAAAAKRTVCRFLTQPHAAAFPNPAAQAHALLLAKDFQAALPVLRDIVARAAPSPVEPGPVLLAWALVETGHFDEAEKYLQTVPVPAEPAPAPFESLTLPRIFDLRAKVAEKKGDRAAAERNSRLFETITGSKRTVATN
jgi:tetratricopeptide (TPR) repeat protein